MAEVFISHSSKDAAVAQTLCGILEQNGISCWMAPRNIMPGDDWATAITKAITTTRVFLIIYSANSAASTEVPKEIMLAGSRHSYIIPYKLDDTPLRENFEYHLGASHWISADASHGDYKAAELLAAVNCGLGNGASTVNNVVVNNYAAGASSPTIYAAPVVSAAPAPVAAPAAAPAKKNKLLPVIIGSAAVVLLGIIALVAVLAGGSKDENSRSSGYEETIEAEGSEKEDKQDKTPQGVIDLRAYDSSNVTEYKGRSDEFLVFGEKHNTGYVLSEYDAWLMFNVKDCTQVTFTLGRIDGTGEEDREVFVYLDGSEYDSYTVTLDSEETITVPLEGAKTMKLFASGNVYKPQLGMYDVEFIGAASDAAETDAPAQESTGGEITVSAYDSDRVTEYKGRSDEFLVFGEKHNTGYVMSELEAWMMFNVKDCTEVTFTVGRIDGTGEEDREIVVNLDGSQYDSYTITAHSSETFTIPLEGAKTMKLFASGNVYKPQLGIYDIRFIGAASEEEQEQELQQTAYQGSYTEYKDGYSEFVIMGKGHSYGYQFSWGEAWAMFNVNGFTEVSFTAGRIDGTNNNSREVYIYLDGKEYDCVTIPVEAEQRITVPINGASTLRLYCKGNGSAPELGFYDFSFSGERQLICPEPENECDVIMYESANITEYNSDEFFVYGESHDKGYVMGFGESRAMLNVNGYTELRFTAATTDRSNFNSRTISILLDGKQYKEYTISPYAPTEITVPLDGVSILQIYSEGRGDNPDVAMFNFERDGSWLPMRQAQVADGIYAPESIGAVSSSRIHEINGGDSFFVCGESYDQGYKSDWAGEFSLAFDAKSYSELSFTAARHDDANFNSRKFTVYLDGVQQQTYTVAPDEPPVQVTVPLNGAAVVEIRGEDGNGSSPELVFYDICFKK